MNRIRQYLNSGFLLAGVFTAFVFLASPAFSVEKNILQAVVHIRATIPPDARTARFLGTDRQGSGVIIDNEGVVLTIGYLILEADGAIVTASNGEQTPAKIVAYDHHTGFGLLRMAKKPTVAPMRLGNSGHLGIQDTVLIASRGGQQPVIAARVVSRRVFTGYWEYMLDRAIFTVPPHGFHSGAALVGEDGRLLAIGSLLVSDAVAPKLHSPGNMFVPIDELKPVLAELLEHGRRQSPPRPWIGANTEEFHGRLAVIRITPGGPAAKAGIEVGDLILGIGSKPIRSQEDFYRKLWATGQAGVSVQLKVLPKNQNEVAIKEFTVRTQDRYDWLKLKRSL